MIPNQSLKAAAVQKGNIICLPHQHCLSIVYSLLYRLGTCLGSTSLFCLSSHALPLVSLWPSLQVDIYVKSSSMFLRSNGLLTLWVDRERLVTFP